MNISIHSCAPGGEDAAGSDAIAAAMADYHKAGLHFVHIPRRNGQPSKAPTGTGWNRPRSADNPHGYTTDPAQAEAWLRVGDNIGVALVPSGIVAFDIDDLAETKRVFAELGLPLDEWLSDPCRVELQSGKPNKAKLLMRVGSASVPSSRKLTFGKGRHQRSIFELRHGSGDGRTMQNVLAPSIHQDTRQPYRLVGDVTNLPEIPAELLALWQAWPESLKTFDHEYRPPTEADRKAYRPTAGERDAIAEFNAAHGLEDLLRRHGYQRRGRRYLRPGSASGLPGVALFEQDGRPLCFSHGADDLNDGHAHDAFDVFRLLDCGGDWKAALAWNPEITAHNQRQWTKARERETFQAWERRGGNAEPPFDPHVGLPCPDREAMLCGLVGDVGRAAAVDTEVNPIAAAAGFISFLSAMAGSDVFLPIGNTRHHARVFTLHVGRSARGRKGDALSLSDRIRHELEFSDLLACVLGQTHEGGLSSREGLVCLIHDGFQQGKQEIPPVDDKRLWIVESEFANVLHQAKREGNTLSAALRDAWDGKSIKPATKNNRVWTTDPHIAMACNVTPSELLGLIESRELSNGFANRFFIFWAEREKLVSFPKPTPEATVVELAERTHAVIEFARGGYPGVKDSRRMTLTKAAKDAYHGLYHGELNRPEDSEILTAILERRAPILLRFAMLFALTDPSLEINERHIAAAAAWIRYGAQSVRFVFAKLASEDDGLGVSDNAEKIVEYLKMHREADRTTLHAKVFKNHIPAEDLNAAITRLLTETPARVELIELPRADGKAGKSRKIYRLKETGEVGEDRGAARPQTGSRGCESVRR